MEVLEEQGLKLVDLGCLDLVQLTTHSRLDHAGLLFSTHGPLLLLFQQFG